MSAVRVKINPLPGTSIAEDKDAAREIRESKILPALEAGNSVRLDFGDVELATQSFIHALISVPIRRFGEDALARVEFVNCTDEVQQLILTVVQYTLMAQETAKPAVNHRRDGT
jgi:hypothetical protein